MTEPHSDSVTFASLGLVDGVMAGIKQAGFVDCTPIQAQTLPLALAVGSPIREAQLFRNLMMNRASAQPALAIFYPALAGVSQPLAGEVAVRRSLLERLPFATGYGVEIAMLLDVLEQVGLDGMAQVDLDTHHNSHQPLLELSGMAYSVLAQIALRLERDGRLLELDPAPLLGVARASLPPPAAERPPMAGTR